MCGRYTLTASLDDLLAEFDLAEPFAVTPRYNVAPTQVMPIIRAQDGEPLPGEGPRREAVFMRWGLIPNWATSASIGGRIINARSETVATQPAFRAAFKRRRCLVPCSGYYEWKVAGERGGKPVKQPHLVRRASGRMMALAGLWECWRSPDAEPIESFTILTTKANAIMSKLHDRMPVMISRASFGDWLALNEIGVSEFDQLSASPDCDLTARPVSTRVNNVRNEDCQCLSEVRAM